MLRICKSGVPLLIALATALVIAGPGCERRAREGNVDSASVPATDKDEKVGEAALGERYRTLLARYRGMDHATQDAADVREQMSKLCDEIVRRFLPVGVSQNTVVRVLGQPASENGDELIYYGRERSWFNIFRFRDKALISYDHENILDLEGGR
jgi:hypothetical protein